jgi:hypothetical protein
VGILARPCLYEPQNKLSLSATKQIIFNQQQNKLSLISNKTNYLYDGLEAHPTREISLKNQFAF